MGNVHVGSGKQSPFLANDEYPTAVARRIFEKIFPDWKAKFLEKNAGYGEGHQRLGIKAQYVDIDRKVWKLRRALWEGEPIGPENPEEVIMDLIGHCFLTLDLLNGKDDPWA